MLRLAVLLACSLALAACTHAPPRNPMAQWVPSPNFNARAPALIVVHFTQQESVEQSLRTLSTGNSHPITSNGRFVTPPAALISERAAAGSGWPMNLRVKSAYALSARRVDSPYQAGMCLSMAWR